MALLGGVDLLLDHLELVIESQVVPLVAAHGVIDLELTRRMRWGNIIVELHSPRYTPQP